MAQYKVPQDVEADDKLLGPFSFRQFVYLLIAAGLIAMAVGLFQLFPLLAILPVPFAFFFLALALPLKKDQPMETYLAAIVSYYLKPHARIWMPGQKEATILITAPKIVEEVRTRDISGEEATHRLSFLADIVDTEGYAIKGAGASPMREDLVAEANATPDMFETYQSQVINRVIDQDKMARHETAVKEMQAAIKRNNSENATPDEPDEPNTIGSGRVIQRRGELTIPSVENEISAALTETPETQTPVNVQADNPPPDTEPEVQPPRIGGLRDYAILKPDVDLDNSSVVVQPDLSIGNDDKSNRSKNNLTRSGAAAKTEKSSTKPINNSIIELANNKDFSVATIAKEANRINRKEKGEVFISLH